MLEAHAIVPLLGQLGVGIALFSYVDTLSWGFSADWDLVPDLHDLVRAVEDSFEELAAASEGVGTGEAAQATNQTTSTRSD